MISWKSTISGIIERYKDHSSIKCLKPKHSYLGNYSKENSTRKVERKRHKKMIYLDKNSDFFAFFMQKDINTFIFALKFHNALIKEADTRKN